MDLFKAGEFEMLNNRNIDLTILGMIFAIATFLIGVTLTKDPMVGVSAAIFTLAGLYWSNNNRGRPCG